MLSINEMSHPFVAGETVEDALRRADQFHPFMAVRLDGKWLRRDDWGQVEVEDGSSLRTVEMIAGG